MSLTEKYIILNVHVPEAEISLAHSVKNNLINKFINALN